MHICLTLGHLTLRAAPTTLSYLFSYLAPADHPLRPVRRMTDRSPNRSVRVPAGKSPPRCRQVSFAGPVRELRRWSDPDYSPLGNRTRISLRNPSLNLPRFVGYPRSHGKCGRSPPSPAVPGDDAVAAPRSPSRPSSWPGSSRARYRVRRGLRRAKG